MIVNGTIKPPKAIKTVHDEIREKFKVLDETMSRHALRELKIKLPKLLDQIEDMVDREENILIPMVKDIINEEEARCMSKQCAVIGYL